MLQQEKKILKRNGFIGNEVDETSTGERIKDAIYDENSVTKGMYEHINYGFNPIFSG